MTALALTASHLHAARVQQDLVGIAFHALTRANQISWILRECHHEQRELSAREQQHVRQAADYLSERIGAFKSDPQ